MRDIRKKAVPMVLALSMALVPACGSSESGQQATGPTEEQAEQSMTATASWDAEKSLPVYRDSMTSAESVTVYMRGDIPYMKIDEFYNKPYFTGAENYPEQASPMVLTHEGSVYEAPAFDGTKATFDVDTDVFTCENLDTYTNAPYYSLYLADRADPSASDLDGQAFWEAMDGIDEGGVRRVQERVVARLLELFPGALDTMHLDHANYHTWIDTANERCVICKRGHNKQKRNDPGQFGLAMLTAAALRLPLVWELYEGNRNDKSEFKDFVEAVAESPVVRDRSDATVVFDGGGNSEEALSSLPFHFVCGHSIEGMRDLYDIDIDEYETVDIGEGRERLAYRVDGLEFSGVKGTGVLTFSQGLYDGQTRDVERMEAKLAKKVSELQRRLDNPRSTLFSRLRAARRESEARRREVESHDGQPGADKAEGRRKRRGPRAMPPEFDEIKAMGEIVSAAAFKEARKLRPYWGVEVAKATGEDGEPSWKVTATRDDEARDAHFRRSFGKKLTVTDRTEWETEEILAAYADQECVENLFRGTKGTDHFSAGPQFHWTDDKIRVHVLICLTSLVLAEVVRAHLAAAGVTVSREAMLDTLSTVHDGWVRVGDRKAVRAVEELDGRKRTMWEAVVAMPGRMPGAR